MKILIADDNHTERLILSKILQKLGHDVVQADNGTTALALFHEHLPEMVFLDVLMPGMDGYDVAYEIKNDKSKPWIPIIFLTSLTDVHDLARCIESGGDDFITKPVNRVILQAKIEAFSRICELYETVEKQSLELQFHNEHLVQEQEAAKKIFNNIAHRGCLNAPNINYHLSPMSIFNGDLMLAANTPMGGMRLMLADFTGHGLPAAIGAMPASEIFYSMTRKGFSIADVMTEMNTRLFEVLPRGIFCCVVVMDIDATDQRLTFWNAGAPDAFLIDKENAQVSRLHSSHLPLGILSPQKFKVTPTILHFGPQHKVLAVTDGIVEAVNTKNEMYGEQRMDAFLRQHHKEEDLCSKLLENVVEFTGDSEQADDLSLLEVSFPDAQADEEEVIPEGAQHSGTLDSKLELELRAKSLGKFDPIPLFLQTLLECHELLTHRSRIFTILSELYNNALEHGVLGLDSGIKSGGDGFARYYQMRSDKLSRIDKGFVCVTVEHNPIDTGGELIFLVRDSGQGFDFEKVIRKGTQSYSGRGLPLLMTLCDELQALDGGRSMRAVYRWHRPDKSRHSITE